jgi:hypothetical protein
LFVGLLSDEDSPPPDDAVVRVWLVEAPLPEAAALAATGRVSVTISAPTPGGWCVAWCCSSCGMVLLF